MYEVTKTLGNDRGYSCVFRNHRADHSHCSWPHGYSLGFEFKYRSPTLDEKLWCYDFGNLKPIKKYLDEGFDHVWLIAQDDPDKFDFMALCEKESKTTHKGVLGNYRMVDGIGCESFAKQVYDFSKDLLRMQKLGHDTRYPVHADTTLHSVKVFEHQGNAATYYG